MKIKVEHSLNNPSEKVIAKINEFEPVDATWSADFSDDQDSLSALIELENQLAAIFGTPVKVQLFQSNGRAICDYSIKYGSMLVTRKSSPKK